jgi:EmrB/QacA subfamily drug resistance transporter
VAPFHGYVDPTTILTTMGESDTSIPRPQTQRLDPRVWRVASVVCIGPFLSQMDATVVNFSLATIRDDMHATIGAAQWIISGYLLALALMLPLNAWCVSRLGAKRLYLLCFSTFTLASMLCGAATSMPALIGARILQGIAGGLLAPMTQLMLAKVAGRHLARIIGYTAVPILLAPIAGPTVAGAILKYAHWPWLFYINLPIGILGVALAAVMLPADAPDPVRRRFDLRGFLLISPGLVCLLYGLEHATQPLGEVLLLGAVALIAAFFVHALRHGEQALVDLRLFAIPVFAAATRTQFLSNGATFAGQLLIPLFLISGCALAPSQAGWLLAPMGLGMLCVYPLMGPLTERFGCRAVSVTGILVAGASTLPFLWMTSHRVGSLMVALAMIGRGAGQSAIGIPSVSAAYAAVPPERLAQATTATNIAQRLGGPVATTLMAIILGLTAPEHGAARPQSFFIPFIVLMVLQALVLAAACRLPLRIHPRS